MPSNVQLTILNLLFRLYRRYARLVDKNYSKNAFKKNVTYWLSKIIKHPRKKINGFDFEYSLNTSLGYQLFFENSFEKTQLEYCKRFIDESSYVLDIGANIGIYSFHYAQIAKDGLVIAIEPGVHAFRLLVKNSNAFKNIIPLNLAVSDKTEVVNFFEAKDAAYSGLKDTGRNQIIGVRKVPCYCTDALLRPLRLQRIDFIKIDVEGYEEEVVSGLVEVISVFKPTILCEICQRNSSNDPDKTIQKILSLGYQAFIFKDNEVVPFEKHHDQYQDYLFIPFKKIDER